MPCPLDEDLEMSGYTVKQVARLSGVSVRTLHHYDEIGLLKPANVGSNGYRYYGREELLRLQQILFHRELGLPLDEIGKLLDAPGFDRIAALTAQRERLLADSRRFRRLARTIEETLAALRGETEMTDKAMYRGFDPGKQAQYEDWLVDRYGDDVRREIEESKTRIKGWSRKEFDDSQAEYEAIEGGLASAVTDGLPADSEPVQALIRRHHAWVGRMWGRTPGRDGYVGLTQTYAGHPDFVARYEARATGLTEYLGQAMRAFAERELA